MAKIKTDELFLTVFAWLLILSLASILSLFLDEVTDTGEIYRQHKRTNEIQVILMDCDTIAIDTIYLTLPDYE